jgi:hypothetical protein
MMGPVAASIWEIRRKISVALEKHVHQVSFAKFLRASSPRTRRSGRRVVLVIVNKIPSHHVGLSQAAPAFALRTDSRLVGFYSSFPTSSGLGRVVDFLMEVILRVRGSSLRSLYSSFGVRGFITPERKRVDSRQVDRDLQLLRRAVQSKVQLEHVTIRGVLIGDLIYDQYLLELRKVTVELADPDLWRIAHRSLELLQFYERFFDRFDVSAVFGNNAYLNAIPNRLALARGVDVYEADVGVQKVGRPDQPNYLADFPGEFSKILDPDFPAQYAKAKAYLSDFVSGRPVQPLFGHSFQSFQRKTTTSGSPLPAGGSRVLVAPHNPFTDSPHAVGYSLFPDYGEWLDHLGRLAAELNYSWLVKIHPDSRDSVSTSRNREWVQDFVSRHPQFAIVPEGTTHATLIESGIDAVLTVHGSIGFEYAACGVPVINASTYHPHSGYSFNYSPRSVMEYDALLRQIPSLSAPVNLEEVAEFFYMRMIESSKSPFFEDLHAVSLRLGGVFNWDRPELYAEFMAEYSTERNVKARASLGPFFDSDDRRWYDRHRF